MCVFWFVDTWIFWPPDWEWNAPIWCDCVALCHWRAGPSLIPDTVRILDPRAQTGKGAVLEVSPFPFCALPRRVSSASRRLIRQRGPSVLLPAFPVGEARDEAVVLPSRGWRSLRRTVRRRPCSPSTSTASTRPSPSTRSWSSSSTPPGEFARARYRRSHVRFACLVFVLSGRSRARFSGSGDSAMGL